METFWSEETQWKIRENLEIEEFSGKLQKILEKSSNLKLKLARGRLALQDGCPTADFLLLWNEVILRVLGRRLTVYGASTRLLPSGNQWRWW